MNRVYQAVNEDCLNDVKRYQDDRTRFTMHVFYLRLIINSLMTPSYSSAVMRHPQQ